MRLKHLCSIFLVQSFSWSYIIIGRETNDVTLPDFETSNTQQDQWDNVFPSSDQPEELGSSSKNNHFVTASLYDGQTNGSTVNDESKVNEELKTNDGSSTSRKTAIQNYDGIYSNAGPLKAIQVRDEVEGVREISYYTTSEGYAVINGDVI